MTRVLFACFAVATIINCFYLVGPPRDFVKDAIRGYTGYFQGKNYMGGFAVVALLLSLHEVLYPGRRRAFGAIIGVLALVFLVLSNSKTALGLAFIAPLLAAFAVAARKMWRLSPAIIPVAIVLGYLLIANVVGFNVYKISYLLYGDSTFTGRKLIWDFAQFEIAHRPLLGWGYQSFWLVGPDAPSVVEAPGWVKFMPNAHNGYLDATLEMGYVGLALLSVFLLTTLHAAGRLVDDNSRRGWLVLSLAFFILMSNGLESLWMRAFEFLWVVFLCVVAEVGSVGEPRRVGGAVRHRRTAYNPSAMRGTGASRPRRFANVTGSS